MLIDFARIDAELDHLFVTVGIHPIRRKLLQVITDGNNHIGLVEAEVDIVVAHEAHSAQGIGMVVREYAFPVKRRGDRDCEFFE